MTPNLRQPAVRPPLPQLVVADSVAPQAWKNGGGQTRELLAWPPGADWQMRVSRADIASDGPFSAFPGVERWFVVLEGAGVVLRFPTADQRLRLGDAPLQFDGAMAPGCSQIEGATQDLNLMVRAGHGQMVPVQSDVPWAAHYVVSGLYVRVAGLWQCRHADGRQQSLALPAHSLLWTDQGADGDGDRDTGQQWQFRAAEARAEPAIGWWLGYYPAQSDAWNGTRSTANLPSGSPSSLPSIVPSSSPSFLPSIVSSGSPAILPTAPPSNALPTHRP